MGQIGTQRHLALTPEVHPQNPPQLARRAGLVDIAAQQFAQGDRRVETHHGMTAVDEDGKQLPERADRLPGLGEQGLEYRVLFAGLASPEYRYRHQLHVEAGVGERGSDH